MNSWCSYTSLLLSTLSQLVPCALAVSKEIRSRILSLFTKTRPLLKIVLLPLDKYFAHPCFDFSAARDLFWSWKSSYVYCKTNKLNIDLTSFQYFFKQLIRSYKKRKCYQLFIHCVHIVEGSNLENKFNQFKNNVAHGSVGYSRGLRSCDVPGSSPSSTLHFYLSRLPYCISLHSAYYVLLCLLFLRSY